MTRAARWAVAGALVGTLGATLVFAPARWAAWAVHQGSAGRVVLGETRGTVWSGQARVTLTGGPGSRDAMTLPGVLDWRLGWKLVGSAEPTGAGPKDRPGAGDEGSSPGTGPAMQLLLGHTEVMPVPVALTLRAGWGQWSLSIPAGSMGGAGAVTPAPRTQTPLLQWPAAWLSALGTPWNTLQPSGLLRLYSPGASLQAAQGRLRLQGSLTLEAADMASRLSTLERLGSYQAQFTGAGPGGSGASMGSAAESATVQISTLEGPLQLSGTGQWVGGRFRLRGEARAAPGQEAALQNLLNLIGPRDGARSVLSIG